MNVNAPDKERRLLPRWRALPESAQQGELQFSHRSKGKPVITESTNQLDVLVARWQKERNIENAVELISTGVVVGINDEVENAAKMLVDLNKEIAPAIVKASKNLLGITTNKDTFNDSILIGNENLFAIYRKISNFKGRVRTAPRDAISWVELARLYTVLGQTESASRCIEVAISLAPDNRFILRSGSRFFVHSNDVDKGLYFIRRSKAIKKDPWLQAAEISLSEIAETSSRYLKKGISSVLNDEWEPRHSAELSGAAATMLRKEGNIKKARKLIKLSIRNPNENALTQAAWASINGWAQEIPLQTLKSCFAYEALALHERHAMRWERAVNACINWGHMEPTSSRPLIFGVFISLVALEDGDKAIYFMEKVQQLKPSDYMVTNNLVVAHAYKGDIKQALDISKNLNLSQAAKDKKPVYLATKGLVAYRTHDLGNGRNLYFDAIKAANTPNLRETKALAIWHMLREESKLGTPELEKLVDHVSRRFKDVISAYPEISALKQKISVDLERSRRKNLVSNTPIQDHHAFNEADI